MTPLEERYRRLLRLLPAAHRARWEEEMVATFLASQDVPDEEQAEHRALLGRPDRHEVVSVARLAVRTRLGGPSAPPRAAAWGAAVRTAALVGLFAGGVAAMMGVWQQAWLAGWLPWPPVPATILSLVAESPPATWATAVWHAWPLLWAAAFVGLVIGNRRGARVLAALAFGGTLLGLLLGVAGIDAGQPIGSFTVGRATDVLVGGLCVLALAAFHDDAPPVQPGSWLRGFAIAVVLAPLPAAVFLTAPLTGVIVLDWAGLWSIALIVAGVVVLRRRPVDGSTAPVLALALLAAVVLLLRVTSLVDYATTGAAGPDGAVTMALGLLEAAGVAGIAATAARRAARSLRTLPPDVGAAMLTRRP